MNTGRIVQVVGPVVDIEFPPKSMPAILNAIKIDGTTDDGKVKIHLTCEVMQHIGYNVVRAVAMSSTDGLVRGMEAVDTGAPISVPVGPGTLGRIFNVLGETVDHDERKVDAADYWPIHRPAPTFDQQATTTKILETGIKVVDLIAPYALGGKIGLFELAHRGTIFLDEIGEIPITLQAKLLRVLQEKEIRRIGSTSVHPIDVRVVSATNINIEEKIRSGQFRSDL